jgi:hypothetical protein
VNILESSKTKVVVVGNEAWEMSNMGDILMKKGDAMATRLTFPEDVAVRKREFLKAGTDFVALGYSGDGNSEYAQRKVDYNVAAMRLAEGYVDKLAEASRDYLAGAKTNENRMRYATIAIALSAVVTMVATIALAVAAFR